MLPYRHLHVFQQADTARPVRSTAQQLVILWRERLRGCVEAMESGLDLITHFAEVAVTLHSSSVFFFS